MHRKASRTKEKLKVALIFFSIYGSLVTILSGLAEISNPSLLSDEMASSDMPMTRNTVFSGIGGQTDLNISFTNATGMTHAITMQNSFADSSRIGRLNLSSFNIPGWNLYKVDVNVSNNLVNAIDDWIIVNTIDADNTILIRPNTSTTYLRMLSQKIEHLWRYNLKEISTFVNINTRNATIPFPNIQLWNKSSIATKPGQEYWSGNLPRIANDEWINTTANFIINASNPADRTWYIVINGTRWGIPKPRLGTEGIYWYADVASTFNGGMYSWSLTADWNLIQRNFCTKYKLLYLNDSTNVNRTFSPSNIYLRANNTILDAQGRISLLGTNIKYIEFTSNTTSANFNVTCKLHYKKVVSSTRTFSIPAPASPVNWKATSSVNVTFPVGTFAESRINASLASDHTMVGVYNASTVAGLLVAPNYTSYTVVSGIIMITGIKSNSTWEIRTQSVNLLSDIVMRVNGAPVLLANLSDPVAFAVNFSTSQTLGNMTVGVYYPFAINETRAFTTSNASFGGGVTVVNLPSIWNTAGKPLGLYRIQARWNISIAAGFIEETFLIQDPIAPITSVVHNGTNYNNITMNTVFTISANDIGTGVARTNITIKNATFTRSWNYLPGNTTFTFQNRHVYSAGLYNVSWYSEDNYGNVEVVGSNNWMIVNLTRITSVTLLSLTQSDYSYVDSSAPFAIHYGKNTTARIRFFDDLNAPINSPDLLNVSVNGQSFTSWTNVGSGLFDVPLTTAALNVGSMHTIIITANETNYNLNRMSYSLTVNPISVALAVESIKQGAIPLQFIPASSVYEGSLLKNVTVVISVLKVLNNEPVMNGLLNLTYKRDGGAVFFSTIVPDAADGSLDGRYTVIIPSSALVDSDEKIYYSWGDASGNYVNSSTTVSITVRFKPYIQSIDWVQLIIIASMFAALAIIYTAVLKKVVIPRRLERHNFLAKISSAFEDAANIQNVLIIHKGSGACLFFKSYGKTGVDPDLITGFLTAIQSFGAEMSGNKALEELTWQDYQLVLGEGELIRVALVLASKASAILKSLVPQFVAKYEYTYQDKLRNWRGDLTSFRDSVTIIDDVFDTSIILPHKRSDLPIKPRTSLARQIFEVASQLTRERDYFFIATLLSESITKTRRSYGEIIAAIQELREDEILVPIDIEALEKRKELSQQEIVALQQRVSQITFLNPDEKAKLLQDLMRMTPNEREASLSSMMIMAQLQSATSQSIHGGGAPLVPSGTTVTSKVSVASASIQTKKAAQTQIKNLDKNAKVCLKNYQYEEAIKLYEQAEIIASQWDMKEELAEITHNKIDATIKDYQYRQAVVLAEAKNAEKSGDVPTAIRKYQEAANYSSALFKLGISTEDKRMREFIKRAEQLKKGSV
nr:hypothetical protein [Candidatus Sigynarchaeota archaeon]